MERLLSEGSVTYYCYIPKFVSSSNSTVVKDTAAGHPSDVGRGGEGERGERGREREREIQV